jgi:hypothetical protein
MVTPTKLIFGVRVSQATKLDVDGGPHGKPLPLWLTTRDRGEATDVACEQGTWTVELSQGDHMVRILAPAPDDWFDGVLRFTVAPEAAIVFYGPPRPRAEYALLAWRATEGTTGGLYGSDPKDPWPPPLDTVIAPFEDAQWLTETLRDARKDIAITRGSPDGL